MNELQNIDVFSFAVSSDGQLIERIGAAQLVSCLNGRIEVADKFACGDVLYRAGELPHSLETALKLPPQVAGFDDPELFAALKGSFSEAAGVSEGDAVILGACVIATWMSGFGGTFCLNLVGPQAVTGRVKALLLAMVRNPLSLATFSLREMGSLPARLLPVVLLSAPPTRALRELALATAGEQLQIVRGGNLELVPRCSAIVCSEDAAPLPAIRINLTGNRMIPLPAGDLDALEERLRPALLGFRLTHYATIDGSTAECGDFSPEVRAWAQLLVAVVAPFPGAPAEVVEALRPQDQAQQASRADSLQGAVLEALFLAIHADTTPPYVQDVARLVNLLLVGGGESELTTRAVGAQLRKLGFACERKGAGYRLVLSKDVRQRVHLLAQQSGIPLPVENSAGCPCCAELILERSDSNHNSTLPDIYDVHDLHDVHDVHDVQPTREMGCAELSARTSRTAEDCP
jgi:hypothetical protein